jgi:hypothetical protein
VFEKTSILANHSTTAYTALDVFIRRLAAIKPGQAEMRLLANQKRFFFQKRVQNYRPDVHPKQS